MAIKLLGHVWRNPAPASPGDRRAGNDWVVEVREPSRWNPVAVRAVAAPQAADVPEPVWAETQPWCHD